MSSFVVHKNLKSVTLIPNTFLDNYMPSANGEFVKVYLYLLRVSETAATLSISSIADILNYTEKDIMRALRYWEQAELLSLSYGPNKTLIDITLLDCKNIQHATEASKLVEASNLSVATKEPSDTIGINSNEMNSNAINFSEKSEEQKVPKKPIYSQNQLSKLVESEEISQLMYIAQRYLGKTFNSAETNTILYIYDSLHFPVELIEYLIEYCVTKEHKSLRYIEKVALSWAEQGITKVAQAKENTTLYNKNSFAVMKAFGLSNRNPGDSELDFILKWTKTLGFSLDIILEACNRTITAIHQPSFEYADSILVKWNSSGVKHLSDIKSLDEIHEKNKEAKDNKPATVSRASNNKFNNITSRSYVYDDLEKQLLSN
ncbi:MAG: DnaD domain protein [Clostridiales bacterium]|nr:DnaD domain protein [Clostridiales bacterium]